jgi:hypothetical protein
MLRVTGTRIPIFALFSWTQGWRGLKFDRKLLKF